MRYELVISREAGTEKTVDSTTAPNEVAAKLWAEELINYLNQYGDIPEGYDAVLVEVETNAMWLFSGLWERI
jgi:hypothetical protein